MGGLLGKLTDVQIKHWIKAANSVAKSDGDGLTFTLSKGGSAAWVLRYRIGGKQREKTLGRFPDMSLKKAREIAADDRVKIQQGIDVGREKQVDKHQAITAWTVRQLTADYEAKVLPGLAASTGVARKQKIRDYILPTIGHLPARDVTGADVVRLLDRAGKKSPRLVKGVLSVLSLVFAHGQARHIVVANPAAGITAKAIVGAEGKTIKVRVMLTDAEIKALLPALSKANRSVELVTRILLSTAVRIQALMIAEWEHIDFVKKEWTIPPGDGRKSERTFVVPLTDAVVRYFHSLKGLAGKSKYVVPVLKRRRGKDGDYPMPPGSINHALERVCANIGDQVREISPHDFRSTARSHLGALGIPVIVAERCLNHSLGGLIAVYDQHDYLEERRRALELWSAKLAILESGADNVISLQGTAN